MQSDGSTSSVRRILDAAGNRAAEGLRVVEDYLRFVLDDRHLTSVGKDLRHRLAAARRELGDRASLAARDTAADVGVDVKTVAERQRADLAAVLRSNFQRATEALRSLEEYSKLVDPQVAAQFEAVRYDTYALERAVDNTAASRDRLANARLYVLVDGGATLDEFTARVQSLVAAGVDVLQLRDKQLADRELLGRARRLRELTRGTGTLFIMNDRPDLAVLSQADGVHVGQEELTVRDARAIVGAAALVGMSTHSIEQARQAVWDGANYLGVGPVFASGTKTFATFPGLDLVAAVAAEITLPAFAIGGISPENLPQVLAAGGRRAALAGALATTTDVAGVVLALRDVLSVVD